MFTIRFPIPLSSLTSLLQGFEGMKSIPEPSFVVLKNKLIHASSKPIIMNGKWFNASHCFISSPHYFATRHQSCARLYVQTELESDKDKQHKQHKQHMKEVLQIEEFYKKSYSSYSYYTYDILVHVEKNNTLLFHKKYYQLTTTQIHELLFV